MLTFLENLEWSRAQTYLSSHFNLNPLDVLLGNRELPVKKIVLGGWSELAEQLDSGNNSLFDSGVGEYEFLIDIKQLEITTKQIDFLKDLTQNNQNYYFYSSSTDTYKTDVKVLFKKNQFLVTSLKKIDPAQALSIAKDYTDVSGAKLHSSSLNKLVNQVETYSEIIDKIDFLNLTGDPEKNLNEVLITTKQEVFMMSFDLNNLGRSVQAWVGIDESELQLAISVVFGKLIKSNHRLAPKILRDLIMTDFNLKTITKIPSLTLWKLFVWKSVNALV